MRTALGRAFRADERIRPHILRELVNPDACDLIQAVAELLQVADA